MDLWIHGLLIHIVEVSRFVTFQGRRRKVSEKGCLCFWSERGTSRAPTWFVLSSRHKASGGARQLQPCSDRGRVRQLTELPSRRMFQGMIKAVMAAVSLGLFG